MEKAILEQLDLSGLKLPEIDLREQFRRMNAMFATQVTPENGFYGIREVDKGNGLIERIGKNEAGHTFKEYFVDGRLTKIRENLGNHQIATIEYDDLGTAYLRTETKLGDNKARVTNMSLAPNTTIVKGNFSATTDAYGRPILNKVTDLSINTAERGSITRFKDASYLSNDHRGHLIAHIFGGPDSKENIVAQLDEVNLRKMKGVEESLRRLKEEGHTVDYEVRSNYIGSTDARPSSFDITATIDGQEVIEFEKIYNTHEPSAVKRVATDLGEKFGGAHETGMQSGLIAAGITFTTSTVDHVSDFIAGEISADEMIVGIIKETGVAGALAYGTDFVSTAVSEAMKKSSHALLRSIGKIGIPAAVISFAVDSYDSIIEFAEGTIDAAEFAYELGDNAVSIVGSIAGSALAGAAVGSIIPGAGTAVGFVAGVVGGTIGCLVASEVYQTTVELVATSAQELQPLLDNVKSYAEDTLSVIKEAVPEQVESARSAINEFLQNNSIPISI